MQENSLVKTNQNMLDVTASRQMQETQNAMIIAQKFPRNIDRAIARIKQSCQRKTLAEKAVYSFPRGDSTVSGPSIRLAEAIAQAWGNLDCGVVEVDRKNSVGNVAGETTLMAYCWDLETNTRIQKVFSVKHQRDTRKGSYLLKDERDIYEACANQGARRLRSCILSQIPIDVIEDALDECENTLKKDKDPMPERINKMLSKFLELKVNKSMIEKKLGHVVEKITENELVNLIKVYNSIKDNFADVTAHFEIVEEVLTEEVKVIEADSKQKKTVKNFAPQTQEEAQKAPLKVDNNKQKIMNEIMGVAKELALTSTELMDISFTRYGKKGGELDENELTSLLEYLISRKLGIA